MLFLKQFRNIEDPQIFQKDAQFTNGSKKMFRQAKGICTASIRKLGKLFSESQEALLSVFHHQKQPTEALCQKRCSEKFRKFTGKHLCKSLLFNKVACLKPATLLKRRLWHRCFPVNFAKFLRTPFLKNTSGRLLLHL